MTDLFSSSYAVFNKVSQKTYFNYPDSTKSLMSIDELLIKIISEIWENEKQKKEVQDLNTNHQQHLADVSQQHANDIRGLNIDHKKEIDR